jgi:NO-binding membrane sensor protein with MHYT domain
VAYAVWIGNTVLLFPHLGGYSMHTVSSMMPMQMHGYINGPITPLLAYTMSCIGSALGLSAMSRTRATEGFVRWRWLALAAVSIGGTGIWVMHFIAMLGYNVTGVSITYDVTTTIVSMIIAIVVVGVGLSIAMVGRATIPALVAGGAVTGLGVASMHYLGMSAMRMPASVHYETPIVLASVTIAMVAATAALWAAMNIRGVFATIGAALIMGVAVTGMHYTGMAAMNVYSAPGPASGGMSADQLLEPLIGGISLVTFVILFVVGLADTESDLLKQAEVHADLRRLSDRGR